MPARDVPCQAEQSSVRRLVELVRARARARAGARVRPRARPRATVRARIRVRARVRVRARARVRGMRLVERGGQQAVSQPEEAAHPPVGLVRARARAG